MKVLSAISWPGEMAERFLAGWRAGRPELPEPPPCAQVFDDSALAALERLSRPAGDHPLARFLARTADSYLAFSLLSHTLPIEEARPHHFANLSRRTERYGVRQVLDAEDED